MKYINDGDDEEEHYENYEKTLMVQTSSSFETAQGKGMKTLQQKQLLQRSLLLLAQMQVGNTSENLLNKIRQIVYTMYSAKQISNKVYNDFPKTL